MSVWAAEEADTRLTGRARYRVGWRGRLVLQVEESFRGMRPPFRPGKMARFVHWRDATVQDLTTLDTRPEAPWTAPPPPDRD